MNLCLSSARLIAAGCALAFLLSACGKRGGPEAMPPLLVKIAAAEKMDTPIILDAFGNTKDRISVDVVPQVSGKLAQTFIRDGAVVTNGQPLFLIDPSDYKAQVRQAEGAAAADRANAELCHLTVERNRPLLEKHLISTEDFDTLKTRLEAATAQLRASQAMLEQAQLNLSRCMITSSVAGVCSRRYVDDGNLVAAGQSRLTNIRGYDPMCVDFSVSEKHLPQIRRALAAGPVRIEITPRGDTNVYEGALDFVDNAVDMQTGTISLRGQAPNPHLKLWAQQFVQARIFVDTIRDAVMAPEGAVQYGKMGPYLYIATKDNKAELRIIKLGVRHNNLVQIVEGVASGENVIVQGQLMLYPGAAVMDLSKTPPLGADGQAPADGKPADKRTRGDQ